MCGIAGLILASAAPAPDRATISRLVDSLRHRGPDGTAVSINGQVALVHNRLSIIDLATGDQPLLAGSSALVANGEIYNYRELRMLMPSVAFATASDCEPPLHLWLRDGADYASALRGMFAIAIHDRDNDTVTLTRDPFGIKPLYVAHIKDGLAFASEPHALLDANLVKRAVHPAARDEFLQLKFTNGTETIFEGIQRIPPGETWTCADGRILDRRRISHLPEGGQEAIDEDTALARLDRALTESVDLHQRSDVPYGLFLSAGVDSAALITVMARLNDEPVLAFTAGFDSPNVADERRDAAAIARAVGARHEAIEITETMVWRHLPEIVSAMDDPAADYAIIPTWFLARRARQDVKVILSGEGGDEMVAGYGRYRRALRPWLLGGRAPWTRGTFDSLDVLRERPTTWRRIIADVEARAHAGNRSKLAAAQFVDLATWVPNDILLKLDRCLMAHGVEGRTPFLDPGVAAAVFSLPDKLKMRGRLGKWLLRKWLDQNLAEARAFAPKQGFTVPIGDWIGRQARRLGPLVASQAGISEVAHPDKVRSLFDNANRSRHHHACWTLLFYALWHRRHIQNLSPIGDVFETLSAQ